MSTSDKEILENVSTPQREEKRILICEDEKLFGKAVRKRLERAGYQCEHVENLADAESALESGGFDLLLQDMRLPDGSGLEFLARLRGELANAIPVVVLTAYGELEDAVTAMKLDAADYLKKPIDLDELLLNVDKVIASSALIKKLDNSLTRERAATGVEFLGNDPDVEAVRGQAERIGKLVADPQMIPPTVLILGETGTGKDLAARWLHHCSARKDKPFVHVDCAALPKDLIEAELFGHEKGAFTNAHNERTGLIEAAEDGVVFLDEIGELPAELQTKLLAVLERRTLRRVGSSRERAVAAWFVAATNRDVQAMVAEGSLRSDLYYRLNVLSLTLPPLHSRGEDVLILAEHFAAQVAQRYAMAAPVFTAQARAAMLAYEWPGNIRELKHVMERTVLLAAGGEIDVNALGLPGGSGASASVAASGSGFPELDELTLEEMEKLMLERALQRSDGNVSEAARSLGITRMAMRYRMQKYSLE